MQTPFLKIFLFILLFSACCHQNIKDKIEIAEPQMRGYREYEALNIGLEKNTGVTLTGAGVEFDPHFFSQNVVRNEGVKPEDWENIVVKRVKMLSPSKFRVMVLPHWWEPYNDNDNPDEYNLRNFDFHTREMQSLYKVLDLADEISAEVTLVLWGCPVNAFLVDTGHIGRHFLCDSGTNWVTGAGDYKEFAENIAALIKHLTAVKGYKCINEITPFNEPDGGVIQLSDYIELVKTLDNKFKEDGIRDIVGFNLSDNTDIRRFFLKGCAGNLQHQADIFNSHTYIFGYESKNSEMFNWEKANIEAVSLSGKPHFIGEFGSNQCVGSTRQKDIDFYKRGVLLARQAINFLNAGACGFSYWSLLDQYYGKYASYEEMQQLGLWKSTKESYRYNPQDYASVKEDYEIRPQYHAYSLLTRFVRKGGRVFPISTGNEYIAATAILNQEGKWVYLFANGNRQGLDFNLANENAGGKDDLYVYLYNEKSLPDSDIMIKASYAISKQDRGYRLHIPPESLVLLSSGSR